MAKKGRKVIPLNSDKDYKGLIHLLIGKYKERFPSELSLFDFLEFLMFAWNTTKLKTIISPDKYLEMIEQIKADGVDIKLFNDISAYCEKNYSDYDQYIVDYEYKLDADDYEFTVKTGNVDAYFKKIEEIHNKFQIESLDDDFTDDIIDRNAIIIGYRKKFIEWANSVNSGNILEPDDLNTYLVDDLEDCKDWLYYNFHMIFNKELMKVTTDDRLWPSKRTFTMFKNWFKVSYSYEVTDLGQEMDDFMDDSLF